MTAQNDVPRTRLAVFAASRKDDAQSKVESTENFIVVDVDASGLRIEARKLGGEMIDSFGIAK